MLFCYYKEHPYCGNDLLRRKQNPENYATSNCVKM
ncbi:hypothetical protein T01_14350 [Trichinella spiralis]|uniref:Uncharacterized protein n=1 Tax=Trichinella spiralis TaxID=6334 RepID=A0A0V1AMT4_TRISP|nr:hypothetical protein T01_14350 [Trichinella spiralis]